MRPGDWPEVSASTPDHLCPCDVGHLSCSVDTVNETCLEAEVNSLPIFSVVHQLINRGGYGRVLNISVLHSSVENPEVP